MVEQAKFESALAAEPSLGLWLIYADWLEERGDLLAEAIRESASDDESRQPLWRSWSGSGSRSWFSEE